VFVVELQCIIKLTCVTLCPVLSFTSFKMEAINFHVPHPGTMCICGVTGSGKTRLVLEIIKRRKELFSVPIDKVLYIYSDFQPIFADLQDVEVTFSNSLVDIEGIIAGPHLVVIDDHMDTIEKGPHNELIKRFFIKHSHHRNISVVLILQNPFAKGLRDINLNTQTLILFDNPRDKSVINYIARQICPGRTKFLSDAYQRAVSTREFGYLVMDLHPQNRKYKYWVRSDLFPSSTCEVYAE